MAATPGLAASASMAAMVMLLDALLPDVGPHARLAILVAAGAAFYLGALILFARPIVEEVLGLVRPGRAAAQTL
jgi:hypothetical protein